MTLKLLTMESTLLMCQTHLAPPSVRLISRVSCVKVVANVLFLRQCVSCHLAVIDLVSIIKFIPSNIRGSLRSYVI